MDAKDLKTIVGSDNYPKKPRKNPYTFRNMVIGGCVVLITITIIILIFKRSKIDISQWPSYTFPNICSISVPPTMEVRNDNSLTGQFYDAAYNSNIFHMMCDECDLFYEKSKVIFQPKGLNSNDVQKILEANSTYARIIIDFSYNEGLGQNDIKSMTRADLKEYDKIVGTKYKNDYECMSNFTNTEAKLIWHPVKKMKINGIYCLALEYDRSEIQGMVKVKKYIFLYDGKEIDVTMSYRECDKEKYKKDFEEAIESFEIYKGFMI